MILTLSLPPCINQTYGVNRNASHPMYKRKIVKDWEFTAGWEVKKQLVEANRFVKKNGEPDSTPIKGDVKVGITWYYRINRDIDAGLKVLLDLLQKQNVYENDRQVREIMYIKILRDIKNPRVEVVIYEM